MLPESASNVRDELADQRDQTAGTGSEAGSASMTIRVPAASLEDAVTELGALGKVSRYTEKTQDVTGTVVEVNDGGIEVKIADSEMTAFIRRADLSRDRNDQRPERFAKGDKVDARVTQYDRKTGKIALSIKALEIAEEKEAVAQYGSSDSGASLGDILGAALKDREKR